MRLNRWHVAGAVATVSAALVGWYAWRSRDPQAEPERVAISGPVGKREANSPNDVLAVRRRLIGLGFRWAEGDGTFDSTLSETLRLMNSILRGQNVVRGSDRVAIEDGWLHEDRAPRWQLMPSQGVGFHNHERSDLRDQHDFGTSWMAEVIRAAGREYQRSHRSGHRGAALLTVNDVSLKRGGPTPDHAGHECGLACDLRLPRRNGTAGGLQHLDPDYDRAATRAQLLALRGQPQVRRILFNDPRLVREGLCRRAPGHDDHVHFEIAPPRSVAKAPTPGDECQEATCK